MGGGAGPGRAEGGKIVRAYELRRSGLHGGQVERGPYPVAGVVGERIIHPRVQNVVAVGLGVGGVTRVEAVRHGPDVHCADVRRQVGVERGHDFLHRHFASIAEAERETPRMDAGIGAGAALDVGAAAEHSLHRVLQNRADRGRIWLDLEPGIAGALVAYPK